MDEKNALEERREVARKLRELRHRTYYNEEVVENIKDAIGIADPVNTFREPEDVYELLADLIDPQDRTCHDVSDSTGRSTPGSRCTGTRLRWHKEADMSINRVIIAGNLTRDPELKQTQGGTPVMRLGVAVSDRRKSPQTGEWEDRPNFVDCAMFGRRAESLAPYLSKGAKVAIDGRLHYSSWQAQDGSRRSKLEVVVDEIELMSRNGSRDASQSVPSAVMEAFPGAKVSEVYDDADIPF